MTGPPPPAPPPQTIGDLVRAELVQLDIREAVLIDDALEPGLNAERWFEAVELLRQQDQGTFKRVEEAVTSQVGTLDALPPAEMLPLVSRLMLDSESSQVRELFTGPAAPEIALERLEQGLTALGLTVRKFWRVDSNVPRDAKLYFLDYRLRPEQPETGGEDVSVLLADIVARLRDEGQPPGAVLMSRSFAERPSQDLEVVARDGGGFVRSNFRYLEKARLDGSDYFLFLLLDLLKSLPLGREYFGQVRSFRIATKSVVDRVAAEICGLLPADFNPFLLRLTGGDDRLAARIADHILEMVTGLMAAELRNDPDINRSVSGLIDLLKNSTMTAPAGLESHTLHRIHQKLLYDRSDWVRRSPPSFGDIYRRRGDVTGYYLLVSPECDLELRMTETGLAPKIERLLLVRGMAKDERPLKKDERFVVTSLAEDSPHAPMKWFYWDLRQVTVLPVRQVRPDRMLSEKWGRLRRQEAEDIQMRLGSDLLAVGTEDVSGRVREKTGKVVVIGTDGVEEVLGDVSIMEIEPPGKEGDTQWALGLGSELLLCLADESRLAPAFVTSLRSYMSSKDFIIKLSQQKVVVAHEGETLHVGFWPRKQALPKKGEWKGPKLNAPVVPNENPAASPGTQKSETM